MTMAPRVNRRDVVVRCANGKHAVRLAGGLGLWRGARCPVCRTPVDPRRTRRLLRWLRNLTRPASTWWLHRVVWAASLAFLGSSLFAAGLLWGLSDVWWPATVLLFGPRWVLLLPLALLIPLAAVWDRQLIPLLLLSGLILLGPVLGFRTGLRWPVAERATEPVVQVITLNARGGGTLLTSPLNLLAEWDPDIMALQECGPGLVAELEKDSSWKVDSRSGVCLVSRLPILDVTEMERDALEFAGGSGVVVTYTLDLGGRPIRVTNVHLETPRAGFELVRSGRLRAGIPKVSEKSILRGIELKRAATWAEDIAGPQIVLGDFNTPPESRLYRREWSHWRNAFSVAGRGLGGTRLNGWIRARIDHILVNGDWRVLEAWVGEDVGSDHLPVFARIQARPGLPTRSLEGDT